jgi:hypothetical protein
MDNSIPMVFLDEYEELEPFDTLGYSATPGGLGLPTHSVSTFEYLCKLSTIANRILCSLYAEKSLQMDPEVSIEHHRLYMLNSPAGTNLCQHISRSNSILLGVQIAQAVVWFFPIPYL